MKCIQCGGRSQLPLCRTCTAQLDQMLGELDWLLLELETTAIRQDRLTTGMAKPAERPLPANMDAVELFRSTTLALRGITDALDSTLTAAEPRVLIHWLRDRLPALVGLSDADRHYRTVAYWVGVAGRGPIHDVINRPDRRFAGPCPDCEKICYARSDDVYTVCVGCGIPIDVEKNRARTIAKHDLLPVSMLLRVLDNLDEHVSRVRLYGWITSGRLPIAGYLGSGGVGPRKVGRHDPRVYSLSRARALLRRELASA